MSEINKKEVGQRLKYFRNEYLGMSQRKFGETIGLKQSSINEIESGNNSLTERNLNLICNTHNANPKWLLYGIEPIFNKPKEPLIDIIAKEYSLSDTAKAIVENYLNLPEDSQKMLEDYIFNIVQSSEAIKTRLAKIQEQEKK